MRERGDQPKDLASPGLWELYFAVVLVAVIVLTVVPDNGQALATRLVVAGLLLAMGVWYVAVGRPIIVAPHRTWRGYVFQAGLLCLFAPAYVLVNSASFMLAALTPLAYMTLRVKAGHAMVAAFAFTPAVTNLVMTGDVTDLRVLVPFGAIIFGVSAAVAVTIERSERQSEERAALIQELEATRAEVGRLSREAGIAEERQRVAGDIHDTVAQGLSSVVMLVQAAEAAMDSDLDTARRHLAMAARTARENLDEARAIVGALTPTPLAEASLPEALRRLADRITAESDITVSFAVDGPQRTLPTGVDVVLLRVGQEALNNVRKHSGTAEAAMRLVFGERSVLLRVSDQGCGFDPGGLSTGYGLGAMRARVEQVGGRLIVDSAPGKGTTVRTEIDA